MDLQKQVCQLEFAKKIKELGVAQKSLFYYDISPCGDDFVIFCAKNNSEIDRITFVETGNISAFTAADLGEMLPVFIDGEWYIAPGKEGKGVKRYKLYLAKSENGEWFIEYQEWSLHKLDSYELLVQRNADTEADARAKMLIYLLENKLIDPATLSK